MESELGLNLQGLFVKNKNAPAYLFNGKKIGAAFRVKATPPKNDTSVITSMGFCLL